MQSRLALIARSMGIYSSALKYGFSSLEPVSVPVQIIEKTAINHDSYHYKLKFISQTLKFSIGQHFRVTQLIKTSQCAEGEEVEKRYTPISPSTQTDTIDVLIKIYRKNSSLKYPMGGKLTPYLESLKVGDKLNIEGPFGRIEYQPNGTVIIDNEKSVFKRLFFIAGGSGITPCYHMISQISRMANEKVELVLLSANKTEEDIWLKKELDRLQGRVKVHYILDNPSEDWTGLKGYITESILKEICPLDDPNTLYINCGPKGMNFLLSSIFMEKYRDSRVFKF